MEEARRLGADLDHEPVEVEKVRMLAGECFTRKPLLYINAPSYRLGMPSIDRTGQKNQGSMASGLPRRAEFEQESDVLRSHSLFGNQRSEVSVTDAQSSGSAALDRGVHVTRNI